MEKIVKVNMSQIILILFLSRVYITLTDIPPVIGDMEVSDYLVRAVFLGILMFITGIPTFLVMKTNTKVNLLDRCYCISPLFGKVSALIYALTFLYTAIATMARFDLFATSVIFPQTKFTGFLIIIIIACTIAAILGIEALGRSSIFIFSVFIFSFLAIILTITKKIDLQNFSPFLYNGVGSTFEASIISITKTVEFAFLLILTPNIEGKINKGIRRWILGTTFFITLLIFYEIGILGEYLKTQLFSSYTLAVLADFGFLHRIDVLLTATWILCVYMKVSITLYVLKDCIKLLISKKYSKAYIIASGVLLSIVTMFLNTKAYSINNLLNKYLIGTLFSLTVIIIPCILLISEKVKDIKKYEQ